MALVRMEVKRPNTFNRAPFFEELDEDFELAVELHFDGAWTALAVSGDDPPQPESLGTRQQRFSVLAVDEEDAGVEASAPSLP